ncbi:hypothetical protein niasHT_016094 [Heterodera trifolii]|uniref:Costars domain-containing protein n=1 Tax=Heterodera trifolii TaxID=157864 RepID=A0ABD2LB09_9BILA
MIKRRIKRRTPAVVIITCTVRVISVPCVAGSAQKSTKVAAVAAKCADARGAENEALSAADEKRRRLFQMMAATKAKTEKMRENLAPQKLGAISNGKYSMTTDDKGGGDNHTPAYSSTPKNNSNNSDSNNCCKDNGGGGTGLKTQQNPGIAENVRLTLDKMRQKEAQALREHSTDVYAKDYVPKKYAKNSAEYGRPPPGSLTEMRANKASRHVAREMLQLCEVIEEHGHRRRARTNNGNNNSEPGRVVISFGALFNIYQFISDKVVGMLLRARKHGMVDFEGEMLFQRRDEAKLITLLISHEQIQQALSEIGK